jgi:hypothetical protein
MMMPTIEFAKASPTRARAPASAPMTIHGARRPNRERVRSEICPAIGCATIAAKAPIVATIARFASLSCSPNSTAICCGSRMPGTAPQIRNTPKLAGMIQTIRRRRPLMGGGGSSFPAAVATKVFSVMGATADSDGSVMGGPIGLAWRSPSSAGKTI